MVGNVRDRLWELGWAGSKRVTKIPGIGREIARFSDRRFSRRFVADLLRLHDVLADTEISGRNWVWAAMLLGWAREGDLLAHDRDADFALIPQ